MALFNELPVAFPWYDKIEKQYRYKLHADGVCDYKLNSPYDALLPFEFKRQSNIYGPQKWEILNINTNAIVADVSVDVSQIRARTRGSDDYFYYAGGQLHTTSGPLNLDVANFYYSRITMYNGQQFYSEMFYVSDPPFSIGGSETTNLLKIEWWNDSDLAPLFYNDTDLGGKPFFRNVVYLDTFIHESEPEIEEENTTDGNGKNIPTFQRAIIRYTIADLVPNFLKVALVLMQMHDHVIITSAGGVYSGEVDDIETTSTSEANGFLAAVQIIFEEPLAIIKKACDDNMLAPIYVIPEEPVLYHVLLSGTNVLIAALIPSGFWGVLYGSTTEFGTYTPINGPLSNLDLLAGTATIPNSQIGPNVFFYLNVQNFNNSGLLTNTVPKT